MINQYNCLLWPDIPVRNDKRDITESLPIVLTSVTCKTCNSISKKIKITQKGTKKKKKKRPKKGEIKVNKIGKKGLLTLAY